MIRLRPLALLLTCLALVLLLAGFLMIGLYWAAVAGLLLLGSWLYAFWRAADWAPAFGFGLVGAFAILGVLFEPIERAGGLNFSLLLLPLLLGLAGYDLAELSARWQVAGPAERERSDRLRQHFARLGLVLFSGLLLSVFAATIQISLSFGVLVGLLLFGVMIFGLLLRNLFSKQD